MSNFFYEVTCMVKTSKSKKGVWRKWNHETCFFKDEKQADLWVAAKINQYKKKQDGFTYLFKINKRGFVDDHPERIAKCVLETT